MKKCTRDHQVQQILLSGLSGRKAPSSMGKISTAEVLRLRATSAVSRDKSVRRSAQDDDFVGVLTKNTLIQVSAYGPTPRRFRPRYVLARGTPPIPSAPAMTHSPTGINLETVVLTQTL